MKRLQQKLAEQLSEARTHNGKEITELKVQIKNFENQLKDAKMGSEDKTKKHQQLR